MRDMDKILNIWVAWASNDYSGVDYSRIAAGFKGLLQYETISSPACTDDDALTLKLACRDSSKVDRMSIMLS